jgi:hypothetical protein
VIIVNIVAGVGTWVHRGGGGEHLKVHLRIYFVS